MRRNFVVGLTALASTLSTPAGAVSTGTFTLTLVVPVDCTLHHTSQGAGGVSGNAFALGQIDEYCNAPAGYQIVVNYTPGTLNGTIISAGEDQVVLNGSGQAVLTNAPGPRIRARALTAVPGEHGFDTDHLDFQIQPV